MGLRIFIFLRFLFLLKSETAKVALSFLLKNTRFLFYLTNGSWGMRRSVSESSFVVIVVLFILASLISKEILSAPHA